MSWAGEVNGRDDCVAPVLVISGDPSLLNFGRAVPEIWSIGNSVRSLSRRFGVSGVAFVNDDASGRMDDGTGSGVVSGCQRTPHTTTFDVRFSSYESLNVCSRRFRFGGDISETVGNLGISTGP